MKNALLTAFCLSLPLLWPWESMGQEAPPATSADGKSMIEIRGDERAADADRLTAIWLYPEDHVGKKIRLRGYIFEPENFEYFPDLNGYLFSCEPMVYGRNNAFHAHIGNATFLSREKLNFFCSTAEGQRIREHFKKHLKDWAIPAMVVFEVRERDGIHFADLVSYTPQEPETAPDENK